MAYFPLFFDIEAKKILVVGGGNIATRRTEVLLEFGAAITVVSQDLSEKMVAWQKEGKLNIKKKAFAKEDIYGMELVLSATNCSETEQMVYQLCKASGILVNLASDRTKCDFYFPAVIKNEDMVIGLTSGGIDHHAVKRMAGELRELLQNR